MSNYNERLNKILNSGDGFLHCCGDYQDEAKQALTSLIKELVEEAIGEDESLVEVHKRNLVVASQFNAVVKSRNSLRHKQRQALNNLLKALEGKSE